VKRRRQSESPRGVTRKAPREIKTKKDQPALKMFLVPCSCGTTFAVAENYDRQGTAWGRYLPCPTCGKRHDPKNRLLQMGYQCDGFWKVDEC
jgi:hydrogenase maturation factor HypF (carbamoyltransferase family)